MQDDEQQQRPTEVAKGTLLGLPSTLGRLLGGAGTAVKLKA